MLFPLSGHSRDFHLRPSVQERERQLNRFYAEILRHAVAVSRHARTEIARHVNGYVSTGYWKISQMLHEHKIESGYGDSIVRRLSVD